MPRYWSRYPTGLYLPVEQYEGVILDSGLLIPAKLPTGLIEVLMDLVHPPDEEQWQERELIRNLQRYTTDNIWTKDEVTENGRSL
jgi:hypothetical protein